MESVSEAAEEYCLRMGALIRERSDGLPTTLKNLKAIAEVNAKEGFLAGAEWMRQQFTLYGTDGCKTCEGGRATLYATLGGECISCAYKREDARKEPS